MLSRQRSRRSGVRVEAATKRSWKGEGQVEGLRGMGRRGEKGRDSCVRATNRVEAKAVSADSRRYEALGERDEGNIQSGQHGEAPARGGTHLQMSDPSATRHAYVRHKRVSENGSLTELTQYFSPIFLPSTDSGGSPTASPPSRRDDWTKASSCLKRSSEVASHWQGLRLVEEEWMSDEKGARGEK